MVKRMISGDGKQAPDKVIPIGFRGLRSSPLRVPAVPQFVQRRIAPRREALARNRFHT
jgi:hypothetical protein